MKKAKFSEEQSAYANRRLGDECLNVNQFMLIDDAPQKVEAWRKGLQLRSSLQFATDLIPSAFARQSSHTGTKNTANSRLELSNPKFGLSSEPSR